MEKEKLDELARLHAEAQKTTWQAGAAREIYAAFPAILEYVRELEGEVDRVRNMSVKWLAENNAQQRREGAAEAYERAGDMLSVFTGCADAEEMMRDAAKRLREGGE